jgi:hypothetical protein
MTEPFPQPGFRDRLLDLEPLSDAREQKLKKEVASMFEYTITGKRRWSWIGYVVGNAFFTLVAGVVAIVGKVSILERTIWLVGAAACMASMIYALRALRRGFVDMRWQFAFGKVLPAISLGLVVLVIAYTMDHPTIQNLCWIAMGLAWLILAVAITLHNRIVASELNQKEQVLKLQYRIAELTEKFQTK